MTAVRNNARLTRPLETTHVDGLCVAGHVRMRPANVGLNIPIEVARSLANWCAWSLICLGLWALDAHAQISPPLLVNLPAKEGAIDPRILTPVEPSARALTELANKPSTDAQHKIPVGPLLELQVNNLAVQLTQRDQFNGVRQIDQNNTAYASPEEWIDPLKTLPTQLATGWFLPGDVRMKDCGPLDRAPYGFIAEGNMQKGALTSDATRLQPLTLEQAVDLALCRNPQVRSAWAAIKVQAASLGEAKASDLPTLSMGVGAVQDETRYPGSPFESSTRNGNTLNASLTWRLWDMGTRAANQQTAQQLLNAALFSHDAVLQKLLSNVVAAYFDAQTAQAGWVARQQTEDLAKKTLDIAKRRQDQGMGSPSDTLQAATALAKARLERSRAKGGYDKARSILVNVTGLSYGASISVQESPDSSISGAPQHLAVDLKAELGEWLERAMNHPSLQATRSQLAAAQDKIQAIRLDGGPTLDFSTNYFQNGRPNQGLSSTQTQQTLATVTLNIPLFEGFGRSYKVRGAQALADQRRAELQSSEGQVLMEVVKAHADAIASLDNLDASQDLQRWAEEAAASVLRRYERGVSDILEMISSQTALADARQERIRCLADWQSARLRLLASAGAIGRQSVGLQ